MNDDKRKKEQFEYLFLDIEWTQASEKTEPERYELIQIAAIAVDADMQKIKSFSKIIRLRDSKMLNKERIKLSRTPAGNMIHGVLESFVQTFPEYQYIVMWNRDTYNLFERSMNQYEICMKRHKVVTFREVFNKIFGNESGSDEFKQALEYAGIDYLPNFLAYSKYKTDYLYQLFCKYYQQYSDMLSENNIDKICKQFQVSYTISNDVVFIRTAFSRWIIYLRDGKVSKLYHENYKFGKSQYCKRQKLKCTEGYHEQKLPSEDFYEVIRYIKIHDTGSVKRLAKKNRIEKLLEMVEMEMQLKNMEEERLWQ